MNSHFLPLILCALLIGVCLSMGAVAFGGSTVEDLWLRPGETFVEMTTDNTPLCSESGGWGYPDGTCSNVLVNGNCADSNDSDDPPEMEMTITGLNPNTSYSFDAILVSDRNYCDNNPTKYGVSAGFTSGTLQNYFTNNTNAILTNSVLDTGSTDPLSLNRVPIDTTTSNASGEVHIFFDNIIDTRALIDGIVYREPTAPPTPALIAEVDRSGGTADTNDCPYYGVDPSGYDGESDPLASSAHGIELGALAFSDWPIYFDSVDESLAGAEFVRTFNRDRHDEDSYTYDVSLGGSSHDEVFLMVLVDDRFTDFDDDDDPETPNVDYQQTEVDSIVSAFANAGDFVDMGHDVGITRNTQDPTPLSAYGMTVSGDATYTFSRATDANVHYLIAALPVAQSSIPGDTNGDLIVDETDATTVATHWGDAVTGGSSDGDFNDDGFVDATDASIMAANWGNHNEGEGDGCVPEPGMLGLLAGALALMFARGRRRLNG